MWETVMPGALIEFTREQGGRPLVGEVADVSVNACTVLFLDFWGRQTVTQLVPRAMVTCVVCRSTSVDPGFQVKGSAEVPGGGNVLNRCCELVSGPRQGKSVGSVLLP
eukprot:gnl/TRDRNA2_/TRDRNA2_37697_c0_seq1.p1 gnl/TRDRNA2_/TRDRNA2_37697_c0~~gnl/TRDRNA2_/TRDRNA2_37697_c0_seq1.p1  ORF type:complete len:118 (-),score=9.22 gnl/TRDRNA2_/TRDRNA2_37697_c0_seq1:8-331(-)